MRPFFRRHARTVIRPAETGGLGFPELPTPQGCVVLGKFPEDIFQSFQKFSLLTRIPGSQSHETHFSAQQDQTQAHARFSRAHEHPRRPRGPVRASRQGTRAPVGLIPRTLACRGRWLSEIAAPASCAGVPRRSGARAPSAQRRFHRLLRRQRPGLPASRGNGVAPRGVARHRAQPDQAHCPRGVPRVSGPTAGGGHRGSGGEAGRRRRQSGPAPGPGPTL